VIAAETISSRLVKTLTSTEGLNEFFEVAMPLLTETFGADRAMLIDYRENTGHFDLLHFSGYGQHSRFELQHLVHSLDVRRSLSQQEPYLIGGNLLCVPLYFMSALEAVIVFESQSAIFLTDERAGIARIVSKFIGLLMSSKRLLINQTGQVDFNDLQRARQIQLTYLPQENLETDRYEIYGYNQSSALVGGDYFDYFRTRERSIQCILADAAGHGLSAALIMSTFRALLHAEVEEFHNGAELFGSLNQRIHSGTSVVQYLTGVFLDYDETENRLRYTNAGHFDPALIRSDGTVDRLGGGGPPLGMFRGSSYPASDAAVSPGDLLVLFTDGFTDIRNAADEMFGEERIVRSVTQHRTRPLKEIASVLLNEGMSFSATSQPEDDLTLFLLRFH
jgi:sigma-B regulation protein RsbU (phosphoserine phosphatase)